MLSRDTFDRIACILVLVIAAIAGLWFVGPRLSIWQANQAINKLVDRIELADDIDVKVPLRQLEGWGVRGLDALVRLASSERTAVAMEARKIVEENFANWQFHLIEGDDSGIEFALQLTKSLEAHAEGFGVAGSQWVERLIVELIDNSSQLNAENTAKILERCERTLAVIPAQGHRLRTIPSTSSQIEDLLPKSQSPGIGLENLAIPSESIIQEQLEAMRTLPADLAMESLEAEDTPEALSDWNPEWQGDALPSPSVATPSQPRAIPSPVTVRILEPRLRNTPSSSTTAVQDVPSPHTIQTYIEQYQGESSEVLMEKMPLLDFYQAGAVREVLKERGFDDRELSLIHRMSSEDFNDRLKLVEDFSQLRANQARRWLKELTKDEHPQVRMKALTVLSTTNAPEVYSLAREMALSDTDQKVVELATRIMKQSRR